MHSMEKITAHHFAEHFRLLYCGNAEYRGGHGYGPHDRDHFLLIYAESGSGEITLEGKTLLFPTHSVLIAYPNTPVSYVSHTEQNWKIHWLGLAGDEVWAYLKLLQVMPERPVLPVYCYKEMEQLLQELFEGADNQTLSGRLLCHAQAHRFFSVLGKASGDVDAAQRQIRAVIDFLDFHFDAELKLSQLADSFHMSRNHLTRQFKLETGQTPVDYIAYKRIEKACYLLKNTRASVGEIAQAVGIRDALYFSRFFKKHMGCTPSAFRLRPLP